ncbi:MAG: type II toxin-antitoxin system Phd/YefM family antitoxin [Methylocystis sp.]
MRNERQNARSRNPQEKAEKTRGESVSPWSVASAKAHFPEVLEKARAEGPQIITRNGKQTAVVVGIDEWERRTKRKGSLVDFLLNSPLRGADLDLERIREQPREIDL